jgi:hypothetical protein
MNSHSKFSVDWFYSHKFILPFIDLAVLKCPYGGGVIINFLKKK